MDLAWYITPNQKLEALGYEPSDNPLMDEPWPNGKPLSQLQSVDDGFDEMMNELGVRGANNYEKPTNGNGQLNGAKR